MMSAQTKKKNGKKKAATKSAMPADLAVKIPKQPVLPLTQRESEVASLIVEDLPNIDIGKVLGISVETVKEHVQNSLRKTKIRSRTGLALWYDRQNRSSK